MVYTGAGYTARTKRVKVTHDDDDDEMLFKLNDFGLTIYSQGFSLSLMVASRLRYRPFGKTNTTRIPQGKERSEQILRHKNGLLHELGNQTKDDKISQPAIYKGLLIYGKKVAYALLLCDSQFALRRTDVVALNQL